MHTSTPQLISVQNVQGYAEDIQPVDQPTQTCEPSPKLVIADNLHYVNVQALGTLSSRLIPICQPTQESYVLLIR